jgi:prepilin-type N-terminal cleavage/methylation domain-containing protein
VQASSPHSRSAHGFTLVEMLVVIGIISILLVATLPVVQSLSKSSGRKNAIGMLMGAVEQARAQAISDGRPTYLAFPAQPSGGGSSVTDTGLIRDYFYRSFAIFEDDATDPVANPKVQLTAYKSLPVGVSLRPEISALPWTAAAFRFAPAGASAAPSFPYLKFNANGEIESPPNGVLALSVFEGSVNGTTEQKTTAQLVADSISISRFTGRAFPTATP